MDGKKTGGRAEGVPNEVTRVMREKISKGGVCEFLLGIVNGDKKFKDVVTTVYEGKVEIHEIERYPNIQERIVVAKELLRKIMPELKAMDITSQDKPIRHITLVAHDGKEIKE